MFIETTTTQNQLRRSDMFMETAMKNETISANAASTAMRQRIHAAPLGLEICCERLAINRSLLRS